MYRIPIAGHLAKKFTALVALVGLTSMCAGSTARAEQLDFHGALDRALKKSPDYDSTVRSFEISKLSTRNAWAKMLPSLDLSLNHSVESIGGSDYYNSVNLNPHDPWTNSLQLSLNETLYDNGQILRDAETAELERDIQEQTMKSQRNHLLVSVAEAFYDYSAASISLGLLKSQGETVRKQFRTIETRYRGGLSSNRDYLRILAQVQRSDISILNQTYQLQQAKEKLKTTIGDSSADLEFIPYDPESIDPSHLVFPKVTPEDSYDFQIATLREKVADVAYRSAERAFWPQLNLAGKAGYMKPQYFGQNFPVVDDPQWTASATLTVTYNILDWGILRRGIEIQANNRQIEANTQNRARINVRSALITLDESRQNLSKTFSISSQILRANENVYTSLDRGYREGKVNYIDLITALGDLYSSRIEDVTLRFNLLRVRADLAAYQGNADDVLR